MKIYSTTEEAHHRLQVAVFSHLHYIL